MVKHYIRLLVFMLVLGSLASGLLLGMDALTADRIEANEEAELKTTVMDAYGITYTTGNLHEVFDETVEVVAEDDLVIYISRESGEVSIPFDGSGVWGPIKGILTLESDQETILKVAVLQQEETPGLGGVVADPDYLAKYVGVKMTPNILIVKDLINPEPNEVDAITGATRTSEAFEVILNQAYEDHKHLLTERKE